MEYNTAEYVRTLREFVLKDLSRWYIRLIRDRTWPSYEGEDKSAAFYAMYYVFENLVRLLAPVCPFISEEIYRSVSGKMESVHLEAWPETEGVDGKTEEPMDRAREIVEAINSLRQENAVRLRWPLRKAVVVGLENTQGVKKIIEHAGNVKEVYFDGETGGMVSKDMPEGKVFLDVRMDSELIEESMIMELVRKIQTIRKDKQLDVSESIVLFVRSDAKTERSLRKWEDTLKKSTGAVKIEYAEHGDSGVLEFEGVRIHVGLDVTRQ